MNLSAVDRLDILDLIGQAEQHLPQRGVGDLGSDRLGEPGPSRLRDGTVAT